MPAVRNVAVHLGSLGLFASWMLIASVPIAACAEEGSRWWPFGKSEKAAESVPVVSDAPAETPAPQTLARPRVGTMSTAERDSRWFFGPWGSPNKPKQAAPQRTVPQSAAPQSGPMNGVQNVGRNVSKATSNAWNATVDKLKWGGKPSREDEYAAEQRQRQQQLQAATEPKKPGFFARLFGTEPEEPEGPRTVTEWMAQERPGMNK